MDYLDSALFRSLYLFVVGSVFVALTLLSRLVWRKTTMVEIGLAAAGVVLMGMSLVMAMFIFVRLVA